MLLTVSTISVKLTSIIKIFLAYYGISSFSPHAAKVHPRKVPYHNTLCCKPLHAVNSCYKKTYHSFFSSLRLHHAYVHSSTWYESLESTCSPGSEFSPAASPDSLEICRHLYNACRSRSMTETYAIMENLRSLLEAKFGSTKFVKDYETIRSALTQGQDFSCVEHVITGDFRLYFPIVIQLVQLECCSKL